jgi:ABC-type transport system involved in multi-copper enzyme maturation permease subunit
MKLLVIIRHTLKEALRKRVMLAGLIITGLFLLLYGIGTHFVFSSMQQNAQGGSMAGGTVGAKTIHDFEAALFLFMGMFVANLTAGLIAIFTSCGTIATEVEQKTLQPLITRPIKRYQLVIGKWLGHAFLLIVYLAVMFATLILIVYSQSGWLPNNVFLAGSVFVLEALVVLSIAIFGSTFLPTAANAVAVTMLFMIALIGGIMEQAGVIIGKKALFTTGIITSIIMPTDSIYRYTVHLLKPVPKKISPFIPSQVADMSPFGAASPPSVWMIAYALVFCIIFIVGAIAVFSNRDL